jgi:hypothetical protein
MHTATCDLDQMAYRHPNAPILHKAGFLRTLVFILICGAAVCLSTASRADDDLDRSLLDWISQNIRFEKISQGKDTLFIRKEPVRAYVRSDDPDLIYRVHNEVSILADAFKLPSTWETTDINLIVVVADHISIDGRPNRDLLASLGLAEGIIDIMVRNVHWDKGCGYYAGSDKDGRLEASIVAVERLNPRVNPGLCAASGVLFSFGLRIRVESPVLDQPLDYIPYVFLARSVADCDRQIDSAQSRDASVNKNSYLTCVRDAMKRKLELR